MKTVIATLLAKPRKKLEDVDYFPGFHHLVQSLKRHNESLPPIVVMSPDIKVLPPGADDILRIREKDFNGIQNVQMAFGKSVYFKLAMFLLPYDRVVFFDTDVLTFDRIDELWDSERYTEFDIYGVRESEDLGLCNPDWQGRLNAGVLVVNKPFLSKVIFQAMIELARSGDSYDHGDQGVLNAYITKNELWDRVGVLQPELNMPSCVRGFGNWDKHKSNIRAMHFLGPRKPWRTSPEHEWFHPDTQKLWDQEVAHHDLVPNQNRPNLSSSFHTSVVRLVQRYERWRGLK